MTNDAALKLIDEVQAIGAVRGWHMREKLLDLVSKATQTERARCARIARELNVPAVAEAIEGMK